MIVGEVCFAVIENIGPGGWPCLYEGRQAGGSRSLEKKVKVITLVTGHVHILDKASVMPFLQVSIK